MRKLVVGVSGLNATENPGPGIGVIRSLREAEEFELTIIGLAYSALEPGIYMDWLVDQSFTLPYPSCSAREYLDRLETIQHETDLNCIIPCLDAELPLYIRYAEDLRLRGIRMALPTSQQFRLRSKDRLDEVAECAGLKLPITRIINDEEGMFRCLDENDFPLFVKGIYYDACLVANPAQAHYQYRRLLAEWGGPVLVQEVIQGEELNVIGAGDGEGGCLGLVGVKKTTTTATGKMWGGVTVRHERLLNAARQFVQKYRWCGPFELECIVRGNDVYLIEINPRFPAWVYFASAVGVNLPVRLLQSMCQLPISPSPDYEAGHLFFRYSYEMVAPMERFQKAVIQGQTP